MCCTMQKRAKTTITQPHHVREHYSNYKHFLSAKSIYTPYTLGHNITNHIIHCCIDCILIYAASNKWLSNQTTTKAKKRDTKIVK